MSIHFLWFWILALAIMKTHIFFFSNKEQPMQLLQSILGRLKSRYEVSAQKVSVYYFHESSICQVANSFIWSTTFNSGNYSEKSTQSSQMGTISSQGVLIWILRADKQYSWLALLKRSLKDWSFTNQPWAPFAGEIHPSQHQTPMRGRPGTALVLEWSLYVMLSLSQSLWITHFASSSLGSTQAPKSFRIHWCFFKGETE